MSVTYFPESLYLCHTLNGKIKHLSCPIDNRSGVWDVIQKPLSSMTKIIGTLGQQSRSVETIEALLNAGMTGKHHTCACLKVTRSNKLWPKLMCS